MLERTKKRLTDQIQITLIGPMRNRAKAIEAVASLGFESVSDAIPWREAFPQYTDQDLPGVCLAGARTREAITQKQLSEMTGIPQRHISEMENGKRPIGKKTAQILAKALNTSYKVFL